MTFADQPASVRFIAMGDEAESVFEKSKPLGNYVRFGFRKPKGIKFSTIVSTMRHTPDYLTETGYLVEVMGLGRDGVLKSLKPEKYDALKRWNSFIKAAGGQGVLAFIWNSHWSTYAIINMDTIKGLIRRAINAGMETFEDGGEYFPIQWRWIVEKAQVLEKWEG